MSKKIRSIPDHIKIDAVTNEDDPILTIGEAAKLLGKHRNTIGNWIKEGIINVGRHPSGLPGIRLSQVEKILRDFPI